MTLRFLDSVDHYTTPTQKWTSAPNVTAVAGAARTGAGGLRNANWNSSPGASITLSAQGTWIVGFAFRCSVMTPGVSPLMATYDAGVVQGRLSLNPDGTLALYRGAVLVATSAFSIQLNTWYYVEFKHVIDPAAGTLEVRVNGAVRATFAGNTRATANSTATAITLRDSGGGNLAANIDYDDLYILDGLGGAPNNAYWGDTQVEALVPNGVGNYTEFTALVGAATHWQATNEVPPNEDTSYVGSVLVGDRDTFTFTDLTPASATINGIQVLIRAREDSAGAANVARLYRRVATDDQGADVPINTSYAYIREVMETDPIAAGAWTVGNVNAAEFGVRSR